MLTLGLGEAEHRLAGFTFTINVGLSVAKFVFAKLEEATEFIILAAARVDVSRHHSEHNPNEEGNNRAPAND